MIEELDRRKWK